MENQPKLTSSPIDIDIVEIDWEYPWERLRVLVYFWGPYDMSCTLPYHKICHPYTNLVSHQTDADKSIDNVIIKHIHLAI